MLRASCQPREQRQAEQRDGKWRAGTRPEKSQNPERRLRITASPSVSAIFGALLPVVSGDGIECLSASSWVGVSGRGRSAFNASFSLSAIAMKWALDRKWKRYFENRIPCCKTDYRCIGRPLESSHEIFNSLQKNALKVIRQKPT